MTVPNPSANSNPANHKKQLNDLLNDLIFVLEWYQPHPDSETSAGWNDIKQKVQIGGYTCLQEFQEEFNLLCYSHLNLFNPQSNQKEYQEINSFWKYASKLINREYENLGEHERVRSSSVGDAVDMVGTENDEESQNVNESENQETEAGSEGVVIKKKRGRKSKKEKEMLEKLKEKEKTEDEEGDSERIPPRPWQPKIALVKRNVDGSFFFSSSPIVPLTEKLDLEGDVQTVSVMPTLTDIENIPPLSSLVQSIIKPSRPKQTQKDHETPVDFLDYGPYSSFAPAYDTSNASMSYNLCSYLYGSRFENGNLPTESIELGESSEAEIDEMDVDVGGDKMNNGLDGVPADQSILNGEFDDELTKLLQDNGVNVGSLKKMLSGQQSQVKGVHEIQVLAIDSVEKAEELLKENEKLLKELMELQDSRFGGDEPDVVGEKELSVARTIQTNLVSILSQVSIRQLLPKSTLSALKSLLFHRTSPLYRGSLPLNKAFAYSSNQVGNVVRNPNTGQLQMGGFPKNATQAPIYNVTKEVKKSFESLAMVTSGMKNAQGNSGSAKSTGGPMGTSSGSMNLKPSASSSSSVGMKPGSIPMQHMSSAYQSASKMQMSRPRSALGSTAGSMNYGGVAPNLAAAKNPNYSAGRGTPGPQASMYRPPAGMPPNGIVPGTPTPMNQLQYPPNMNAYMMSLGMGNLGNPGAMPAGSPPIPSSSSSSSTMFAAQQMMLQQQMMLNMAGMNPMMMMGGMSGGNTAAATPGMIPNRGVGMNMNMQGFGTVGGMGGITPSAIQSPNPKSSAVASSVNAGATATNIMGTPMPMQMPMGMMNVQGTPVPMPMGMPAGMGIGGVPNPMMPGAAGGFKNLGGSSTPMMMGGGFNITGTGVSGSASQGPHSGMGSNQ